MIVDQQDTPSRIQMLLLVHAPAPPPHLTCIRVSPPKGPPWIVLSMVWLNDVNPPVRTCCSSADSFSGTTWRDSLNSLIQRRTVHYLYSDTEREEGEICPRQLSLKNNEVDKQPFAKGQIVLGIQLSPPGDELQSTRASTADPTGSLFSSI